MARGFNHVVLWWDGDFRTADRVHPSASFATAKEAAAHLRKQLKLTHPKSEKAYVRWEERNPRYGTTHPARYEGRSVGRGWVWQWAGRADQLAEGKFERYVGEIQEPPAPEKRDVSPHPAVNADDRAEWVMGLVTSANRALARNSDPAARRELDNVHATIAGWMLQNPHGKLAVGKIEDWARKHSDTPEGKRILERVEQRAEQGRLEQRFAPQRSAKETTRLAVAKNLKSAGLDRAVSKMERTIWRYEQGKGWRTHDLVSATADGEAMLAKAQAAEPSVWFRLAKSKPSKYPSTPTRREPAKGQTIDAGDRVITTSLQPFPVAPALDLNADKSLSWQSKRELSGVALGPGHAETLRAIDENIAHRKQLADADRAAIDAAVQPVAPRMLAALKRLGAGGHWIKVADLRDAVPTKTRNGFDLALLDLGSRVEHRSPSVDPIPAVRLRALTVDDIPLVLPAPKTPAVAAAATAARSDLQSPAKLTAAEKKLIALVMASNERGRLFNIPGDTRKDRAASSLLPGLVERMHLMLVPGSKLRGQGYAVPGHVPSEHAIPPLGDSEIDRRGTQAVRRLIAALAKRPQTVGTRDDILRGWHHLAELRSDPQFRAIGSKIRGATDEAEQWARVHRDAYPQARRLLELDAKLSVHKQLDPIDSGRLTESEAAARDLSVHHPDPPLVSAFRKAVLDWEQDNPRRVPNWQRAGWTLRKVNDTSGAEFWSKDGYRAMVVFGGQKKLSHLFQWVPPEFAGEGWPAPTEEHAGTGNVARPAKSAPGARARKPPRRGGGATSAAHEGGQEVTSGTAKPAKPPKAKAPKVRKPPKAKKPKVRALKRWTCEGYVRVGCGGGGRVVGVKVPRVKASIFTRI